MIKQALIATAWGGILLILAATALPNLASTAAQHSEGPINCDFQTASCVQKLAEGTVTLNILPKPVKAMTDLTFQVRIQGLQAVHNPFIDLGMPGMKMGRNHVELKTVNPGEYEGTGVIVRCSSGRTIWRATVTIPDQGAVDFIFDVIY